MWVRLFSCSLCIFHNIGSEVQQALYESSGRSSRIGRFQKFLMFLGEKEEKVRNRFKRRQMERVSKKGVDEDESTHFCVRNREKWESEIGEEKRRWLEYTNF